MNKRLYMFIMLVALCILQIVPYVPHHHHNGKVCMCVEHCDGTQSQEHDNHSCHHGDFSHCVEDEAYVKSETVVLHVFDHEFKHLISDAVISYFENFIYNIEFDDLSNLNHFSYHETDWLKSIFALRAPPYYSVI